MTDMLTQYLKERKIILVIQPLIQELKSTILVMQAPIQKLVKDNPFHTQLPKQVQLKTTILATQAPSQRLVKTSLFNIQPPNQGQLKPIIPNIRRLSNSTHTPRCQRSMIIIQLLDGVYLTQSRDPQTNLGEGHK
jgi:hypothetical protein